MTDSGSIYISASDPVSLHLMTEQYATAGLENGRVDTGRRDGWEVGIDVHTQPHVMDGEREPAVKRKELCSASVRAQRGGVGGAWVSCPADPNYPMTLTTLSPWVSILYLKSEAIQSGHFFLTVISNAFLFYVKNFLTVLKRNFKK